MTQTPAHLDKQQKPHWAKRLGRSLGKNIWDFIYAIIISAWLNG